MATKTIFTKGYGSKAGLSRTEVYDLQYGKCTPQTGNKPVRSPMLLALPVNGKLFFKTEALVELNQPKWGPMNNLAFWQILPVLEKLPPQKLLGTPAWQPYPSVIPPILVGDYYEGHDDGRYGAVRQYNLYHQEENDLSVWDSLGIVEWRTKGSQPVYIDNPEYELAVQRNNERRALYLQILHETFILTGLYQFPAYPLGDWEWKEDGVKIGGMFTDPKIPLDTNHWLAMPDSGWKMIQMPVPQSEQENSTQWQGKVNNTILLVPPTYPVDYRVKKLLGM